MKVVKCLLLKLKIMSKTKYIDPWIAYPTIWKTKSAFFTWLRGNLRRAVWEKYPGKIQFKNNECNPPPKDYVGRAKSGAYCALSNNWTAKSYLEVDHKVGNASLKEWSDVTSFIQHLCTNDLNMQLVSKEAHKIKSYAERQNITYEEATAIKQAIKIVKDKKDKQFFIDRKLTPPNNQALRRKQIIDILLKEK